MSILSSLSNLDAVYTLAGALTAAVLAVAGAFAKLRKTKGQLVMAEQEIKDQSEALCYTLFPPGSQEVIADLSNLFDESMLDRFLMLKAWNGQYSPKYTNSVFQYRLGRQEVTSYEAWKTDEWYNWMLNQTEEKGYHIIKVADMPKSRLRDAYLMEGVKYSVVFFISKNQSKYNPKRYLISYCSFATHEDVEITHEVIYKCEMIVGKIRMHENYSFA